MGLAECRSGLTDAVVHPTSEVLGKDGFPPCIDYSGAEIGHGMRYRPRGFDACTTCLCECGNSSMCVATLCSAPQGCRNPHPVDDKCCEFECLDRGDGFGGSAPPSNVTAFGPNDTELLNTTNFGLRLVASTVTSFLILALLLFMIHRLRQRRLLLMIRRINGGHMSGGPFGPRRYSIDDDGSVGYLTGRDQVDFAPYDEPPPPYTFWKPPESYFPQEEAPPPYDAHYHINVGIGTVTGNGNNRGSVGIGDNNNAVDNHQREIMTSVRVPAPIPTPYSPVRSASIHHCPGQDISVTRGQPVCNSSPLQRVAIPSLSQVSLRAKDFQMNNLDRECDGNALRHAVPFQDLNVVGSLSSLNSSQSEINESQASVEDVVAGGQALAIIRSDAVYEEHQRAGLIPPMTPGAEPPHSNLLFCTASSDWDCTSRIVVSSQFPCETYDTIRGRRDLNPAVGTDESSVQRQGPTLDRQRVLQGVAFRCHSCSDVLECRRLRNELHDPLCKCHSTVKRRSLQPVGTRFCPPADPTAWIVDASETSSSSSPTYDRTATISPTSSDSSSIDYGFGGHLDDDDTSTPRGSISNYDHLPRRTRSDSQFTNKRSSAIVHPSSPASTAAGLTMAPSASGNVVLRPKSSSLDRTLDSLRSKVSLSKKSKGPSRLRQLLGGLHSSGDPSKELSKDLPPATVPKQVELQGSPGTSEGGAPIVQKVSSKTGMPPPVPPPRADSLGPRFSNNGHRPVVRRTPRISYVSDGDISLRNLLRPTDGALGENSGQCFNTELNDTTEPTDTHVEKRDRPRSYDFGDLNGAHRGNAGVGGASVGSLAEEGVTVSPAAGCDAGQNDRSSTASVTQLPDCSCSYSSAKLGSSWDSFTCTCSSRASFGSTRSGSSPSREGPASPLESCSSPVRCSSAAVEPPSSPDEREFDPASPTHKCSDRIHCLDSGAQVPPRGTGHRTSLYDQRANSETHRDSVAGAREVEDVDVGGDVRRVPTVMIAPVLESEVKPSVPQPPASTLAVANRIRVTIGSWKESHESYI